MHEYCCKNTSPAQAAPAATTPWRRALAMPSYMGRFIRGCEGVLVSNHLRCVHTVHTRNVKRCSFQGQARDTPTQSFRFCSQTALLTVRVCARACVRRAICTTQACTDINGILGPVPATDTFQTHVFAFMSTHTHAFACMTTHQLSVLADSYAHGLHSAMALHIRQSFSKSATFCDLSFLL